MFRNRLVKIALYPFSLLYGIGISFRNAVYDAGLLKSSQFNLPVISVGNLSIGGTGKTPHIEYLVRLLKDYLELAILSRGYMRKTKGFRFVTKSDAALQVGDEPLVYKRKYPDIIVAVSESRATGIPQILQSNPQIQTILLDDAFQHRAVKPGLNILLSSFDNLFTRDLLLPSGRLREWRAAYKRADIIVVTKCPASLSDQQRTNLVDEIKPLHHQTIYFSYYHYFSPYFIYNPQYRQKLDKSVHITLLAAIANTDYLMSYLEEICDDLETIYYEDHHFFTKHDMSQLKLAFDAIDHKNKIILTTEKDAVRIASHSNYIIENKLPIYVLPIVPRFHFKEGSKFDEHIKKYLLNFQT